VVAIGMSLSSMVVVLNSLRLIRGVPALVAGVGPAAAITAASVAPQPALQGISS